MLSSYTWSQELLSTSLISNEATEGVVGLSRKQQMLALSNTLEISNAPTFVKGIDLLLDQHIVPFYDSYEYENSSLASNRNRPVDVRKTMDTMWCTLPTSMKLEAGGVPKKRLLRKRQQVANVYAYTEQLIEEALASSKSANGEMINVVEFAAGSGHIILPLAYSYRKCKSIHFTCIDLKPEGIDIANDRVTRSELDNITLICGRIEDYDKDFDVGLSLHACGSATDAVIDACLKANAAMVICACCIGKIGSNKSSLSKYLDADEANMILSTTSKRKGIEPKSTLFQGAISSSSSSTSQVRGMWSSIVKAADFGHNEDIFFQQKGKKTNRLRRLAKSMVEYDRVHEIKEYGGYDVSLFVMSPRSASSKNDIIVARPKRDRERNGENNNNMDKIDLSSMNTCMVLDKENLVDYLLYGEG